MNLNFAFCTLHFAFKICRGESSRRGNFNYFIILHLLNKRSKCQIVLVQVRLGNNFKRRVHGDYRHADVDGVDVHVRNVFRDRTATANVHFAKLARLPNDTIVVEELTKVAHVFRIRIGRTALTARARKFGYACATGKPSRKSAILDAVDEGLIDRDPTRKVIIKGKDPRQKKIKFLNQFELHTLIKSLDLGNKINFDWLILLIAKTGMRFSEALGLTPKDFDFSHQTVSINKTWDYKEKCGFQQTKNKSSVRKIQLDWMVVSQFAGLIKNIPEDQPIFINKDIYNSTINSILARHCKKANIPVITIHGLRHTHASLLLFAGVSIASVAKRLGHASMTTTQKVYLHVIQELENKDVDLVM